MTRSHRVLTLFALSLAACADSATSPARPDEGFRQIAGEEATATNALVGEVVYGLTSDNSLVRFSSSKPNQTQVEVEITGLAAGEQVLGIDFRPSDLNGDATNDVGKLYGVTNASRIYLIDPLTGVASSPVTMTVALGGTAIGVGFNPVPDRLRIHTTTNQNLRINVDNGATIVDGPLSYRAGDAGFGVDPDVIATGYTNNDNDPATGTALFAIDANRDVLVTFPAATGGPNGGQMATVGALGLDVGIIAGFDISAMSGIAYGAILSSPSGKSTLYAIDVGTGWATKLGLLAQTHLPLLGIAVSP